jgi:hypothetical protein
MLDETEYTVVHRNLYAGLRLRCAAHVCFRLESLRAKAHIDLMRGCTG